MSSIRYCWWSISQSFGITSAVVWLDRHTLLSSLADAELLKCLISGLSSPNSEILSVRLVSEGERIPVACSIRDNAGMEILVDQSRCRCGVTKHGLRVRCGASTRNLSFLRVLCDVNSLLRLFVSPDTNQYRCICEDTYLLQRDEWGDVWTLYAAVPLYTT